LKPCYCGDCEDCKYDRHVAAKTAADQSEELAMDALLEDVRDRCSSNPDRAVSELRRLGLY